jgi:hypothetical protein
VHGADSNTFSAAMGAAERFVEVQGTAAAPARLHLSALPPRHLGPPAFGPFLHRADECQRVCALLISLAPTLRCLHIETLAGDDDASDAETGDVGGDSEAGLQAFSQCVFGMQELVALHSLTIAGCYICEADVSTAADLAHVLRGMARLSHLTLRRNTLR